MYTLLSNVAGVTDSSTWNKKKKNELVGEFFHLPMNKADNFFSFVEYQPAPLELRTTTGNKNEK